MRIADCGLRNKNAAVSATNSFPTPHSALRAPLAFTLVELLVVISIIGVLAALIFPVAGCRQAPAVFEDRRRRNGAD